MCIALILLGSPVQWMHYFVLVLVPGEQAPGKPGAFRDASLALSGKHQGESDRFTR